VTEENFFGFVAWITFFLQFLYYRACIMLAHHPLHHPPTDCRVHYMSTPIGSISWKIIPVQFIVSIKRQISIQTFKVRCLSLSKQTISDTTYY
jgi:hypothetical protein